MNFKAWTNEEARNQLCWILEGKASEFYATVMDRNAQIPLQDLMTKLEKRFGNIPQPDTAQDQLSNSRQLPDEKIEDWADRVQQLAARAFPDLQEERMIKQAIKRICHGCLDKEAGQHVVNLNLDSVELVVDKIKSYQYNHKSIFAGSHHSRREVRELSVSPSYDYDSDVSDYEDRVPVSVKQTKFQRDTSSGKTRDPGKTRAMESSQAKIDELSKQVTDLRGDFKSLMRHLETLRSRSPTPSQGSGSTRSRSPSPGGTTKCFRCQGYGHFAKDCPTKTDINKPSKGVSWSDQAHLNELGSGKKA